MCVCMREGEGRRNTWPDLILYFPSSAISLSFLLRSVNTEKDGGQTQSSLVARYFRIIHKTTDVQLEVSSNESDAASANNMS